MNRAAGGGVHSAPGGPLFVHSGTMFTQKDF